MPSESRNGWLAQTQACENGSFKMNIFLYIQVVQFILHLIRSSLVET